jgi:acyl-CoA dehydrogenase
MNMRELVDPFSRLITTECPSSVVREIERGGDWRPLWDSIAASGFLDAMVPEDAGGAGLSLPEAAPLMAIVGAAAVPLPIAETMAARAILAGRGRVVPAGPIVLATGAHAIPLACLGTHALTGSPGEPKLVALGDIEPAGSLQRLDGIVPDAEPGFRPIAAVLRAQLIAGAADHILEMTVSYANERVQFGKPVGRQQAVQQQVALLAEQVVATRMAAALGARAGLGPSPSAAAAAKHVASAAAAQIAAIAHAVHGAIGISEEFDLQLLTRRLHVWRLADGSESYWAEVLGAERCSEGVDRPVS